MRRVALIALAIAVASCDGGAARLNDRISFWEHALSRNVPPGTSREKVVGWGRVNGVTFLYMPEQHRLSALADKIPAGKLDLACSEWTIILTVEFDAADQSTLSKVEKVGTCL